jgi:hypothetical protein
MVVDRATWTIRETHDFERDLGGAQPAFDGTSIFVIADNTDVLVIDPETYEVTDVLEPIRVLDKVNSLATSPGALWVATGDAGILHRYDLPS